MPKQITDKTADMIVRAADRLCDYVGKGDSTLDAGVKVAKEFGLTRDQIKLAGRAYNIGVVNSDRDEGSTFTTKFAVTSRIDPDEVIDHVFPSASKAAGYVGDHIADVYSTLTTKTAKSAGIVLDHDLKVVTPKRKSKLQESMEKKDKDTKYTKAKKKVAQLNELRDNLRILERETGIKCAAVQDAYRQQFGNNTDSLVWVRQTAVEMFGKTAGMLIDPIANKLLGPVMRDKYSSEVSRGSSLGTQPVPITLDSGVFKAVKEAIDTAKKWAAAELAFPAQAIGLRREANKELNRDKQANRLLLPGQSHEQVEEALWEKRSNLMMGLIGGMSARVGSSGVPPSGMDSNAALDAKVKLNDPGHQSELRRLSAETKLNELLNNDEVIGSYSPEEVAAAFEEIHQSAPGVIDNQSLMRANLRRVLQGNLTPFDAESLVNQSRLGANPSLPSSLTALSTGPRPQSDRGQPAPAGY